MGKSGNNIAPLKDEKVAGRSWYQNNNIIFVILNVVFVLAFLGPLRDLLIISWNSEYYSYIPFIPFISAYLIYTNRQIIFSKEKFSYMWGLFVVALAVLLLLSGHAFRHGLDENDYLSAITFCMVLLWIGVFMLCYGVDALRAAAFPLAFLSFAVPLPNALREGVILFLQRGSTEAAYGLFKVTGIPVLREGFIFHLPALNVEVAPECSGIRSGLSLVITGVLAGKLFLTKNWTRTILILSVVPITIVKNGFRIASLSILGAYWNESILRSDLHRKGGVLFFILALVLLGAVIVFLKKIERHQSQSEQARLN